MPLSTVYVTDSGICTARSAASAQQEGFGFIFILKLGVRQESCSRDCKRDDSDTESFCYGHVDASLRLARLRANLKLTILEPLRKHCSSESWHVVR